MGKRNKIPDFKELLSHTQQELGKELGLSNNEIGEKINDKPDLATRIAGGYVGGQMTKNIVRRSKKE
ncbi:small, acid-soluble spore protein, alpha/beta type [Crassaminicella thermophila]|uniref:Small, acid-soluble spore protein, alpha/beta type n=1 Tax=Crassaminicella thermophila TaxID=2599308 RepID=A0A5C0SBA0_CRATE|nr:small, acid-soluble spore protein, alpha/beta type [Crassaminicella thermophila]QEK11895.1 small, acid-soluble spore protein, alpha/beta type [Crassaminicella thermophila]